MRGPTFHLAQVSRGLVKALHIANQIMRHMAEGSSPRVVVAQLGARNSYSVPVALHLYGALEQLCTDIYAEKGVISAGVRMGAKLLRGKALRRWAGRYDSRLPTDRVTTFPRFGLQYKWKVRRSKTPTDRTAAYLWGGKRFCELVVEEGLGNANGVYGFNSASLELLRAAKQAGLTCIVEQTSAPRQVEYALVIEEELRFPGWSWGTAKDELAAEYACREREEWQNADLVICPSQFVKQGIYMEGGPTHRLAVVPYSSNQRFFVNRDRSHQESRLHVLYAGKVNLQKGTAYLARAVAALHSNSVRVSAVGGIALSKVGRSEVERHIKLLGPVPRSEMPGIYQQADVFVFPSLCEGSALVCYEALAAGLPVITTPNAGSVVRDGVDGFIVPIRSPEAIAEKLDLLASNRKLLAELSQNARERASQFTVERYAERLMAAIQGIFPAR